MTSTAPDTAPFLDAFRGRFTSALRWADLDALWARLRACGDAGWYLYAVGESPPDAPADADEVARFIDELDRLLRAEHQERVCGIVYADDLEAPRMIKVYDPNNLGVVCGFSDNPPLPGWVISLLAPADLKAAGQPPAGRRRWWRRMFQPAG